MCWPAAVTCMYVHVLDSCERQDHGRNLLLVKRKVDTAFKLSMLLHVRMTMILATVASPFCQVSSGVCTFLRVFIAPSPIPPSSGDGSSASQQSEEPRSPQAMAQAVRVHDEINKVMYFA